MAPKYGIDSYSDEFFTDIGDGYYVKPRPGIPTNPFNTVFDTGEDLAKIRALTGDEIGDFNYTNISPFYGRDSINQAAMDVFKTGFNNRNQGIMSTEQAQPFEFLSSAYEDQDEDAEQVDYLPGQEPSDIAKLLDYIPFVGEKSLGRAMLNMLPQMSPEAKNIRNFYGSRYGLTDTGQVASGIMKGYNPVSGGFLNMITGGRFGQPTSYGLADAARKRIERIANRKIAQTDASRAKIAELQDIARADTISRARQQNPGVYEGRSGGFDTSAADRAGTSAGSGQGFSNKSGRGRTGY